MVTFFLGDPDWEPNFSISETSSLPSTTSPVEPQISIFVDYVIDEPIRWSIEENQTAIHGHRKNLKKGGLTKDDMLAIEPGSNNGGDKELRSIRVRSSIGHGKQEWTVVLELEVLVWEGVTYLLKIA